jgi:nucleoprotein TPR
MQEMMAELEQRQPEIDELRQENERLTEETGSISELLHEATRERELARKEARKYQGDYQGLLRENEIQRQQLRDLSAQITMLLLQQRAHEGGLDALSDEEKSFLREYTASGTMPKELVSDSTDTGRIISERLVLFKDIHELQKQNQELLRTIREVADRYEGSEALQKTNEIERDRKELARLREQVAQHQDEIKSLELRSQSLTKERDMFRRIVTSRGQIPAGADMEAMFGQSLNGAAPSTPSRNMSQGVEQTPRSKEIAGYEKLVKDLQAHLDALRRESATDMATLRQQRDQLAKDNSQLQGDKMRLENAVQLGNERFELQGNKLSLLQSENNELKKRCDTLQDLAAKQDIKTQQVAEDLLEAKSQAESLERENANLKASRDLAKSTEQRLQSENASLMEERSRLSKMISDLQNLRNEQELTESENRRRLQSRAESLEAELQALKRKLDDEIEEHKRATLLLENEQLKSRNTIDDLRKLINNIRPELASVKTERDHLQARVDELKAELRIAEERGQNLHPRPTPRTTTMDASSEEDITREEQLSIEIANLKHDLEVAQEEKESAKTDAAKYRAIASDSEEQLESWLESQEQFRQEMDGMLAEKENNIRDLEKRVEEISAELAATNTELSELRRTHDEEGALFNQRKAELDSEITRLKEEADRYKQTAAFHQEDLKAQADIATRAQQNYENELVKHSEAMKNLQKEREEHNKLKSEVAQFKAQAEGAREALEEGKEHWSETRERYERELAQSRTKLDELEEQNKIVHQQLENVSTQIASLKQSRVSVAGGDSDALNSDQTSGLQEVVNYLRKEKEILEVQYEIALNENKKLEATVKGLQSQLDQTREMLSAAQQSQAQTQQAGLSLEAYQRNVEQMNTIRESNITLRNELRQATSRLEEKSKEVEDLYAQIQPLQARVQELEIELEATVKELESARQNGDHWQKRCQDVLHKYDRIDPAELEALKDKITSLESERDEASAKNASIEDEKKAIQTELDQANEKIRGFDERRQKMVTQFKDKARELSGKIKEREDRIKEAQDELNMAREQLGQVQKELEVTRAERDEAIANASSSANATNDTTMGEEGQVREDLPSEERQALEERVKAAEDRFNEEANRSVALHIQTQEKDGRVRELENTVVSITQD